MMLGLLLTSVIVVAATTVLHAFGTIYWIRYMMRHYSASGGHFSAHNAMPALTGTAVILLTLHLVEVMVWALAYLFILPDSQLDTLEKAVYFSVVTFTTVGYGDITLVDHEWRLLSGIEALNGILLVGWTTAFLFAVFQRSWKGLAHVDHG
jgi:voltage-gated potassium channel